MRLFHTPFVLKNKQLTLSEERVVKHARVLRLQVWNEIAVQDTVDGVTIRYICCIAEMSKNHILCNILSSDQRLLETWIGMLVGIPNTNDKLHTIVQKLTEIGISDIVFWKNDRSTGQDISVKKLSKICKISLESLEQSNGRQLPTISQVDNIHERVVGKELVLFDFEWQDVTSIQWIPTDRLYGVVWPEGHFSPRDYETIWFQVVSKISLGDHILRTETAAITGAWALKNLI